MIDYDTWLEGGGGALQIPVGEPSAVGLFIGELGWSLRLRVVEANIPAIDYIEAAMPRRPGTSTGSDGGVRFTIIRRLLELERIAERALSRFPEEWRHAWATTRIPSRFSKDTGTTEPLSLRAHARNIGVDHKTVAGWVRACDAALVEELTLRGWQL